VTLSQGGAALSLLLLWMATSGVSGFVLPILRNHVGERGFEPLFMGQRGKRIKKEKKRAMREPTPPRIETPYGPIRLNKPPRKCEKCSGRGMLRCHVCEGRGVVRKTGSSKSNRVEMRNVVGSQWTSVHTREGHRHYRVAEMMGSPKKKNVQLRMGNCCGDPISFWVPVDELKNKSLWRKGWVTLEDIIRADGGELLDVAMCFRCKGDRVLQCLDCGGTGMIESYEPLHN